MNTIKCKYFSSSWPHQTTSSFSWIELASNRAQLKALLPCVIFRSSCLATHCKTSCTKNCTVQQRLKGGLLGDFFFFNPKFPLRKGDTSDQVRIFEIHDPCVFWEMIRKNWFWQTIFRAKIAENRNMEPRLSLFVLLLANILRSYFRYRKRWKSWTYGVCKFHGEKVHEEGNLEQS